MRAHLLERTLSFWRCYGTKPRSRLRGEPEYLSDLAAESNCKWARREIYTDQLRTRRGAGSVALELGAADNFGSTRVRHGEVGTSIPMVSLDEELDRRAITNVRLLKVDVEGAELDVIGAHLTLARCTPLLCIEVHTPQHLLQVLRRIEGLGYVIVDCLGLSPTYVVECNDAGRLTKFAVNRIWLLRACVPPTLKTVRWYLRRICQSLTTGRWDPPADVAGGSP